MVSVAFFHVLFPIIVIYPQYSPLQTFKGGDVLMTETKFITNSGWEGILNHLLEGTVIPPDAVLVFCELYKVVDGLAVVREGDSYQGVFIVILW